MLAGMRVQQAGELSWNRCAAVLCCRSRGKGWRDCGSSRQQQQQDLMHSIECLTIQTCYHKTGAGFSSVACYLSLSWCCSVCALWRCIASTCNNPTATHPPSV